MKDTKPEQEASSKGPYLVLPNRDMATATLIAHHLTWRLHLPHLACPGPSHCTCARALFRCDDHGVTYKGIRSQTDNLNRFIPKAMLEGYYQKRVAREAHGNSATWGWVNVATVDARGGMGWRPEDAAMLTRYAQAREMRGGC